MDRLKQQIEFIMEVDKLKNIYRQNYLSDGSRREDDAEHSWHMALMCSLLMEYSNEKLDVAKTILMILIHDVVEIDAGDTYAYDISANLSKRDKELAAADRIFNLLPKDQAVMLRALWDEFEEGNTPEARFAGTLDRLQPLLLNAYSDGRSWKEHGISKSQVMKRNETTSLGSERLGALAYSIINEQAECGNLVKS